MARILLLIRLEELNDMECRVYDFVEHIEITDFTNEADVVLDSACPRWGMDDEMDYIIKDSGEGKRMKHERVGYWFVKEPLYAIKSFVLVLKANYVTSPVT